MTSVCAWISVAGARAALSAIRSTLIANQESHVRSVCRPTAATTEGVVSGNVDAVAAVAAAAAEQLGGAASSKRDTGRGTGKGEHGSDKLSAEYPVDCVVDGDTGAILFLGT
eukprot:COSAG02_NODE_2720_length_8165_cov_166.651748_2_plen_112_part_00